MKQKIKILHLEDLATDAELVARELKKGKINCEILVVDNRSEFIKGLKKFSPDIILSDHSLPAFNSSEALKIVKEEGITVPFILITATVSEEFAVNVMKEGADDYILKDRLQRLPNAIINACEKYRLEDERQKFLKNVIENEAMLKEAEKLAHFGSWQTDLITGISKWSDEVYRIFGIEQGAIEPSYANFVKCVHAEDKNIVKEAIEAAFNNQEANKINYRVIGKDGSVKYIRSEFVVESNKKKQLGRIIGFNHDITEIKLAEESLKKSEANLRSIFDNSDTGYILLDKHLNILSFNQLAFDWTFIDLKIKLHEGRNFLTNVHFKRREKVKAIMQHVLNGEQIEYETQSADSAWHFVRLVPVKDNNLKIIGLCKSVTDITKRKLNEEAKKKTEAELQAAYQRLEHNESRLREAQALAHVGNWEIDIPINVHTWSDEMYKVFGLNREEVIPSQELFLSVIYPEDLNSVNLRISESFTTFKNASFDFRFIGKNNLVRYGYSEWRFEFDKDKKPVRLFGIIQDVTERKLAETERTKMVNELIQRNKDLEQFAYIISHNLRAPVANILGTSSALNDPDLNEKEKETLMNGLTESVLSLDNVVKDLNHVLQVKREINETKEKVNLSDIVEDIKISIGNLIKKDNIEIKCDFSEIGEMVTLKSYLHSIFFNLISNSIKYRQPKTPCIIEIKSHCKKDAMELIFSDNGMGFDLKKRGDQVFGLYKRFHANMEGKGMGLFMVKTQVEILGGKINVKSEVNKGTEFTIEFEA